MYKDTAPLTEWKHFEAFDTAFECEEERHKLVEEAKKRKEQVARSTKEAREAALSQVLHYISSRCIASDDPRLR